MGHTCTRLHESIHMSCVWWTCVVYYYIKAAPDSNLLHVPNTKKAEYTGNSNFTGFQS